MALMPAMTSMLGGAAASAGTAAATSLGASAVGAGMGAAGSLLGGISAYQQGMFQSKLAGYNAQLALQEAGQNLQAGQTGEEEQLLKTGKEVGAVTASQAAGGVDVGVGSAKQVQEATEAAGRFDAATMHYNTMTKVYGLGQEATSDLLQKKVAQNQAVMGLIGGVLGAGSSFAGGASSMADKWLQFGKAGVPGLSVPGPTVTGTTPSGDVTFG
jgi:hypothetical protein